MPVTFLPSCPQRSLSKPCMTRSVAGSQSASPRAPRTDWIPAFAGMTSVSKGIQSQMTPLPEATTRLTPGRRPCYQHKGVVLEHHLEREKAR